MYVKILNILRKRKKYTSYYEIFLSKVVKLWFIKSSYCMWLTQIFLLTDLGLKKANNNSNYESRFVTKIKFKSIPCMVTSIITFLHRQFRCIWISNYNMFRIYPVDSTSQYHTIYKKLQNLDNIWFQQKIWNIPN